MILEMRLIDLEILCIYQCAKKERNWCLMPGNMEVTLFVKGGRGRSGGRTPVALLRRIFCFFPYTHYAADGT